MAKVLKFPGRGPLPLAEADSSGDNFPLPANLPRPVDDGACAHLVRKQMPAVKLPSHLGQTIDVSALPSRSSIIFSYVSSGVPGKYLRHGWDQIPGARGGTPQARGFRDLYSQFAEFGAAVFGLSAEDSDHQRELVDRLRLPFTLLSDADFRLADALRLPTFELEGERFIKRLTMVVRSGTIEMVFYPVFPADENAERVLYWLRNTL